MSKWALPLAAVYGALVWLGAGLLVQQLWAPFVMMFLATYVMAELNNRNALLRIRSRMVSFSFIFLSMMNVVALADWRVALVQMCFALSLFVIFMTCQNDHAVGAMYTSFMCLGVASIAWVHILYLAPVLILLTLRPLFAFSFKTFSAAILGLLTPYWVVLAYLVYIGDLQSLVDHFIKLADFSPLLHYEYVTIGTLVVFSILVILMLTGIVHFLRKAYNDKIRVRVLFRVLMILALVLTALISVVPYYANYLIALLEVVVAPLIAHFIVFTRTKVTNWAFIIGFVMIIAVMLFEICLTSLYNTALGVCL